MNRNEFVSMLECAQKYCHTHARIKLKDAQLAEEVSWEAAVSAFETWTSNPNTFPDVANLRQWMKRRAIWRAVDTLRYRNKHVPLLVAKEGEVNYDMIPARDTSNDDNRMEMWKHLADLEEEERSILLAYYYDGLTDQDIGTRIYGEQEGSLQSRGLKVWRRRQKIQERLRETMESDGWTCADLVAI